MIPFLYDEKSKNIKDLSVTDLSKAKYVVAATDLELHVSAKKRLCNAPLKFAKPHIMALKLLTMIEFSVDCYTKHS